MSLTRKVTTLTASIVIYNHDLSGVQLAGLIVAIGAMFMNFVRRKPQEDNSHGTTANQIKYSSVPTNHTAERPNNA
jgi:hypothetical protein